MHASSLGLGWGCGWSASQAAKPDNVASVADDCRLCVCLFERHAGTLATECALLIDRVSE
jgi:hypothetical protein